MDAGENAIVTSVVIIDDQSTSRVILEELVGGLDPGIVVHSFADPRAALAWIARHPPDLVLTDYRMPGMDGVELVRRLRALPACADVPIIVVTVIEDRVVRYQALEAGATDILSKPVDHHECRARCQNLLALRRQARLLRNRGRLAQPALAGLRERDALLRLARVATLREDPEGIGVDRVAFVARALARRLGLGPQACETIEVAATLHDVGKAALPDAIVLKAGPLTAAERGIVEGHCRIGHELLERGESPCLETAAQIALYHHERYDGQGYPQGLRGEAIPLAARIAAIADAFDALVSPRAFRPAMSMERAVEILNRHKGTAYDPGCIEAFNTQLDRIWASETDRRMLKDVD